ncbi:MAG: hypothetical protein IMZ69_11480 [Spirochaetes bacterium]|nr:hypothetical protein [Spirochaetota bacterium]
MLLGVLVVAALGSPSYAERPLVGAIRWDAWQDNGSVRAAVEKALGPSQWHGRLPFFSRITGPNSVQVDGNSQAVMDQEIGYAAKAGIDYWAFCAYPDNLGMSNGLHLYLKSEYKSRIRFCLNLQGGWISNPADWETEVKRYVGYFKDRSYQTVLGNRPLVYLFSAPDMVRKGKYADWDAVRAAFDRLRAAASQAGVGNPYIVLQGWEARGDQGIMKSIGADALSAYAVARGSSTGMAFAALAGEAHASWETGKAAGANVVPLVTAGWDNRPRVENPPPWTVGSKEHCVTPTAAELANHLADALDWTRAHRATATPAYTVLVYAWNEHDEGGWLCPTLKPDGKTADTSRMDAIEAVLGRDSAVKP